MSGAAMAGEAPPMVVVVEDDLGLREALGGLLRSAGMGVTLLGSASGLWQERLLDSAGCLVLDVRLPGISGLDLQRRLAARPRPVPIIFMTGYGDIPMSVRAMKEGAVDFLPKPFSDQAMLDAVAAALAHDRRHREEVAALAGLRARLDSLTPREREVLAQVAAGLLNKQIAAELGLSEITVKIHRGRIMRKMAAESFADLVRMFDRLNRPAGEAGHG